MSSVGLVPAIGASALFAVSERSTVESASSPVPTTTPTDVPAVPTVP